MGKSGTSNTKLYMFHNPKYFRAILFWPVRFGSTTKDQDFFALIFSAFSVYKI